MRDYTTVGFVSTGGDGQQKKKGRVSSDAPSPQPRPDAGMKE